MGRLDGHVRQSTLTLGKVRDAVLQDPQVEVIVPSQSPLAGRGDQGSTSERNPSRTSRMMYFL
jgi:hypothetical protein